MKKNSMNVKLSMVVAATLVMLPSSQAQTIYASLYERPDTPAEVKADVLVKDASMEQKVGDLKSNKNYWVDFLNETIKDENLSNVPDIAEKPSGLIQDKDYWANYVESAVETEMASNTTQNEKSEFSKMKTDKIYWADYLNNVQE